MSVNTELTRKGIFFEPSEEHPIMNLVGMIIDQNTKEKTGDVVRQALLNEWEDTTEVIVRNVLEAVQATPPARTSSDAV